MIEFARKMLSIRDAIIVDTETTGLGSDAEIVQLSIIGIDGRIIFNHLIKPIRAIVEDEAAFVTGITNDIVKDMLYLRDHIDVLLPLSGCDVIAYNANFDERMIRQSAKANESAELTTLFNSWKWHDAMEPYADFWGDWSDYFGNNKWQKLTAACEQQGIVVKNAHDALGDVFMTLELLKKVSKYGKKNESTNIL